VVIIAVAVWALLPRSDAKGTIRLGTDPAHVQNLPPSVKYVIRMHPGAYLPGLMPDNVGQPLKGLNIVAAEFEKRFPDTRIEFVGVPSGMREWLVTQLSSGQAPDIVQVNVEEVWQDVQKNWYVPLNKYLEAPNPFVENGQPGSEKWWDLFKYPIPTRGTCAPDGNFYCITTDMIETGIYYNKDIFQKLGLDEPKDWSEFLEIQKKIRQAGYVPTLVERAAFTDWGIDLTFYQVYSEIADLLDLRYDPRSGDYLKGYLDWDELAFLHSKGFFSPQDPRWVQTFRILKDWRQYMGKNLASNEMLKSFVTQRGAMLWSHSMVVNRLARDPDVSFKWGVFYLPPIPKSFNRFCSGREQCVIGGSGMQYEISNSALKDTPANLPMHERMKRSERLKRVVAFLQFLTTPRNADTVVNEIVALVPNIKGAEFHHELKPFHEFLQRDYSMTKWYYTFDLQFDEVLLRMFELYLNDGISEPEFLDWMQRNLDWACEKVAKRKNLDFQALQTEWDKRAEMRKSIRDLPPNVN
jgi:raffinose/stachyose/melibiose transport system substrate-binding protein